MSQLFRAVHRHGIAAAWLAFSLALTSTGLRAASADDYLADAQARYDAGEYTAAAIQLKNAIQLDPNHAGARVLLGKTHLELGNIDAADEEFTMAATLGASAGTYFDEQLQILLALHRFKAATELDIPSGLPPEILARVHFRRGLAQMELGQFDAAETSFTHARDAQPRSGQPIAGQALLRLQRKQLDAAKQLVAEGLTLAPENSDLWQAKATISSAEGRLDAALDAYRRALQIDEENDNIRLNFASTLVDAGRYREASSELKNLRTRNPDGAKLNYLLGVTLNALGEKKAAREALAKASSAVAGIPPQDLIEHPPSLFLAGLITFSNGEFNAAIDYLAAYLDLDEVHLPSRRLLASSLIRVGRPLEAIESLRTLTARGLADASVYSLLGEAYTAAGLHADAIKALNQAAEIGGENASTLRSFGKSQIAMGNRGAGIAALERSVALNPDQQGTQLYLASMYLASGLPDEALSIANSMLLKQPGHLVAMNLKATALVHLGDLERARNGYEQILAMDPSFRPAELNLAKLEVREKQYSAARERLARLLLKEPKNTFLMLEMARIEAAQGKRKVAIDWLERARQLAPDDIKTGLALTRLYQQIGEREAAVTNALQLKGYHPQNLQVLEALALAQLAVDDRTGAINTLRSMSVLSANAPGMLRRIAGLARRAGDEQTAYRALTQAVAAAPEDVRTRVALAQLALARDKLDDAKGHAMMLVDQAPDLAVGPILLAEVAMREQEYKKAFDYFTNAPGAEDLDTVAIGIFRAQMARNKPELAMQSLTSWSEQHPDSEAPLRVLAEAHHRRGEIEQAQRYYERILALRPQDPWALNNLANIYAEAGDERALKMALAAYDAQPSNPHIMDTLASLHLKLGQPEKALPLLRDAVARRQQSGTIRYNLALALEALGRRQEAIRELREALTKPDLANSEEAKLKLKKLESS